MAAVGQIAIEREGSAGVARGRLVAQHRHGQPYGEAPTAAHALDALYGQLVTAQIKANGPRGDVGRAAHIRECLKRRFNTGKKDENGWRHLAGFSAFGMQLSTLRKSTCLQCSIRLESVTPAHLMLTIVQKVPVVRSSY